MTDRREDTDAAAPSDRWTRRMGIVTLVLVVAFVALLFAFRPGGSGGDSDVSDECREARDRATVFVRFPSPTRLAEMRRACGSGDER